MKNLLALSILLLVSVGQAKEVKVIDIDSKIGSAERSFKFIQAMINDYPRARWFRVCVQAARSESTINEAKTLAYQAYRTAKYNNDLPNDAEHRPADYLMSDTENLSEEWAQILRECDAADLQTPTLSAYTINEINQEFALIDKDVRSYFNAQKQK